MTDRITEILKAYTKKHNISASSVILEEYAEELLANGVIVPPCNCAECKYLKIVDEAPIFAECSNPKVIRKFLYFEEDTRKASCEYAEEKLKELKSNA